MEPLKLFPDCFEDPAARMHPPGLCDTVTITAVLAGTDTYIADIAADADADTTATLTHGLGVTPLEVTITWLTAAAALSLWRATTINSTQVVLTKATTGSSGAAPVQARVIIKKPHTIGR